MTHTPAEQVSKQLFASQMSIKTRGVSDTKAGVYVCLNSALAPENVGVRLVY